jgi:hypothetical protein
MTLHMRIRSGQCLYEGYRSTQDASMRRDRAISRQDEQRLFPSYSTRYVTKKPLYVGNFVRLGADVLGLSSSPSPNGVPIVPGETFKISPGETSKKRNPLQVWCSRNAFIPL